MKCNHCNTEVADGTNFCPNCGNKIEVPQAMKCPQCNTEVAEGVKYCPNCGSVIGISLPKKCGKCGSELEDGEKYCSNCGAPVESGFHPHKGNNNQAQDNKLNTRPNPANIINIIWDGERKQPTWNNPISVSVNNQKCAEFSPKNSFEKNLSVTSKQFALQLDYGKGPFSKTDINLELEANQNYVCIFYLNSMGTFGYELKDSQNRIIKEDGDVSMLQILLFLFIPFIGFIYFFMKKDCQPLTAKAGLYMGFGNIVWIILSLLLF